MKEGSKQIMRGGDNMKVNYRLNGSKCLRVATAYYVHVVFEKLNMYAEL
jgi:hypothetical protein